MRNNMHMQSENSLCSHVYDMFSHRIYTEKENITNALHIAIANAGFYTSFNSMNRNFQNAHQ